MSMLTKLDAALLALGKVVMDCYTDIDETDYVRIGKASHGPVGNLRVCGVIKTILDLGDEGAEPAEASPKIRRRKSRDPVRQPAHYASGAIECIDCIRAQLSEEEMRGYLRGNVAKYLWRYRGKNKVEDLMKAEVYLGWLKELEEES